MKMLIAVDGSEHARHAVEAVERALRAHQAKVPVLLVR